jgi:hypothetical protein
VLVGKIEEEEEKKSESIEIRQPVLVGKIETISDKQQEAEEKKSESIRDK